MLFSVALEKKSTLQIENRQVEIGYNIEFWSSEWYANDSHDMKHLAYLQLNKIWIVWRRHQDKSTYLQ